MCRCPSILVCGRVIVALPTHAIPMTRTRATYSSVTTLSVVMFCHCHYATGFVSAKRCLFDRVCCRLCVCCRSLCAIVGKHVYSTAKLALWRSFGDTFLDMSRVVVGRKYKYRITVTNTSNRHVRIRVQERGLPFVVLMYSGSSIAPVWDCTRRRTLATSARTPARTDQ